MLILNLLVVVHYYDEIVLDLVAVDLRTAVPVNFKNTFEEPPATLQPGTRT
eukprot:SAG31_NODE_2140_length_6350_cov_2.239962_6_plen_51_part_00